MLNLRKKLTKKNIKDFTVEEVERLENTGLYMHIYRGGVSQEYIDDAMRLAQSMDTIQDGFDTGHVSLEGSQSERGMLISNFKEKYSSYFKD